MKKALLFSLFYAFSMAVLATPVGPMSYQGRLLDDNGVPVTNTSPGLTFVVKIYDDSVGGAIQYQETHTGVAINDGVYSFKIGTQTPDSGVWDVNLWQGNLNNLYLELDVEGETLTPRNELTSSPHAYTATLALSAESLGAKTAAEFDNILEGICVASKGRWLDIAERCLGAGSDFSLSAVGGTVVNITTLHSGTDFTDLDLSNANISGLRFDSSDFTGAQFINTVYNSEGFQFYNNFTSTLWDGATDTNSTAYGYFYAPSNFTNAIIQNMSVAKWYTRNITTTGLSAANLTGCPYSSLPVSWSCLEMISGSGKYIMVGPYANFSAGSAAAPNGSLLVDDGVFNGKDLQFVNFTGTSMSVDMDNINFNDAIFDQTNLKNMLFKNVQMYRTSFEQADLTAVKFLEASVLWQNSFIKASLKNVYIKPDPEDLDLYNTNISYANFNETHLSQVTIGSTTDPKYNYATFSDVSVEYIYTEQQVVNITGATFNGRMRGGWDGYNLPIAQDVSFINTTLSPRDPSGNGGWRWSRYNNCVFDDVEIDSDFYQARFYSCGFSDVRVTKNGDLYGATFDTATTGEETIWWDEGARCPSGAYVSTAGINSCNL